MPHPLFARLQTNGPLARWLTPVWVAFFGSLLLSFIAIKTDTTLNRDGMLYVDTARAFLSDGLSGALATFNWPFLPILMAILSRLTGLHPETAGHLLNAFFLAGACGLMVDSARRGFPEASWLTCLVVLALPGMNHYRNELLREFGCWFFLTLSFWLALRWSEKPRGLTLACAPIALLLAGLFRSEALALFPALLLHLILATRRNQSSLRPLTVVAAIVASGLLFSLLAFLDTPEIFSRILGDFGRINQERFDAKATALASALIPYARDQAEGILFWGSLAIIPIKLLKQLGLLLIPVLYLLSSTRPLLPILTRWRPFSWAFLLQIVVLSIFVLDMQFAAGRYVAILQFLAAPLIGFAAWHFANRFSRWKNIVIVLLIAVAINNVLSLRPGKQHFIEAGEWLAANASDSPRNYIESARSAYYAGWRFSGRQTPAHRENLRESLAQKDYDLVVIEVSDDDPDPTPSLSSLGLQEIRRFGSDSGRVIIARPAPEN